MKKIYLVMAAVAVLASCNNAKKEGTTNVAAADTTQTAVVDIHNAQNALDVDGTYSGKLPTASGSGMEMKITLAGDTYKKSVVYVGKSAKPIETTGKFTWEANGSVITLGSEEVPNKYFVGENTLTQLDTKGQKVTGNHADMYVLKKN